MAKILNNLVLEEKDVNNLRELVNLTVLQDEDYGKFTRIVSVVDGGVVGFIGDMNDVGWTGAGCKPEYKNPTIANGKKKWELGAWEIPLELCYTDVEGTVAEYSLKQGTQIGDLTGTDFLNVVIRPALERQVKRMFWRKGWFGDTAANYISKGGVVTEGADLSLLTTNDGFFKRIFAQGAENASQVTTIAANTQETFAKAKTAMLGAGVATGIVDTVLMDADARINENGGILMMTKAMADALAHDIKKTYNTSLEWQTIFDGFDVANYDGVQVARIGIWDQMIRAYENGGAKLNKPYRIVYANPQNFLTGIPQGNIATDLDIFFDRKERTTNIYAAGKIGTHILEDDMFHAAY